MLSLIEKNSPKDIRNEAYRTLRTNFQFFTKDKNVKLLVLTSTESGEGASVTARNLALSFSLSGKKVLIIDCDLRKPSIHEYFNVTNQIGFANLIIEKLTYKDVIQEYSDNLHIITAGKTTIHSAELLNTEYISPIFQQLQKQYDIILIDSPPVITYADAQLLSAVSDGVIMVVSIGKTHKKLCQKAIHLLQNVNADIIGIVLNKNIKKLQKYYKKNKSYSYKKIEKKKVREN
ncbi:MAG: CpsD/CapB family tyrosine-protein kinase [Clostridiaceae bacterium]